MTDTFSSTVREVSYRSKFDLVATDEILSRLQIGLARLRRELELEQQRALADQSEDELSTDVTPVTAERLIESQPEKTTRVWYYAVDGLTSAA